MSRFKSHQIPWGALGFLDSLTIIDLCVWKWFSFQFHLNTHPPNMTFSFLWAVALWQPKGILFPQNKSHLSMNNEHNHFWFDWLKLDFQAALSHTNQSQCTEMNDWDFSLSLTQLWDLKMYMSFEMIEWMHTQYNESHCCQGLTELVDLIPTHEFSAQLHLKDWIDFYCKKNTLSKMSVHKKREWLVHLCKGEETFIDF